MRFFIPSALALLLFFAVPRSAFAFDTVRGGQIFNTNCVACHAGGGNVVKGERTLRQADLEAFLPNYLTGHDTAIVAQVTYGRSAMPAFLDVLSENEINDVAAYVEDQASHGWS
jgi:cytochrome c6|tara:strand:- start:3156 stop:3497 length:342 start_codon:yes stop_codon:yes gene_type:complete